MRYIIIFLKKSIFLLHYMEFYFKQSYNNIKGKKEDDYMKFVFNASHGQRFLVLLNLSNYLKEE